MSGTIVTHRACPQLYFRELLAPRHAALHATLAQVGREWERIVYPGRLRRWLRLGRAMHFSAEAYAPVVASVSSATLRTTLWHVAMLRHHPRVRGNLAAIVFLEHFEAVVAVELARRRALPGAGVSGGSWWLDATPAHPG